MMYIRLWCFADACLMPHLQNQAMQAFLNLLEYTRVDATAIRLGFELTSEDSVLRLAMMEEAVYDYGSKREVERGLKVEAMDILGTIPGLMASFVEKLIECRGAECAHDPKCRVTTGKGHARFMVKEIRGFY